MTFRSRSLLDLAHRVTECQVRIPGVCAGHSDHGCEPAHSNQQRHGKGMGHKAADCFHAAACHACHAELDQGSRLTKEERRDYWQAAHERTLQLYFENGWLKVAA
ncbi:MAG: DUF1364 family protein [Rhodocyclaceae bacterium]|nr:DUF1364 family protein [Rhodocyclaceae bacterium]